MVGQVSLNPHTDALSVSRSKETSAQWEWGVTDWKALHGNGKSSIYCEYNPQSLL